MRDEAGPFQAHDEVDAAPQRARKAAEDQAAIAALAQRLDALANGNLTHEITEAFAPKAPQLKADFNQTATRLRDAMATTAAAIQGTNAGTGEISKASDDLSRRTEQQAASLEQTAAMDEMDQVTQQNTAMVEQSTAASRRLCRRLPS